MQRKFLIDWFGSIGYTTVLVIGILSPSTLASSIPSAEVTSSSTQLNTVDLNQEQAQLNSQFFNAALISQTSLSSAQTAIELPPLSNPDVFLPTLDLAAETRLVIDLSDRRLYVYTHDQLDTSFPIAIGRDGWETPIGNHFVMQMQENPAWQHPFTNQVFPPGEGNPLGARWIGFWTDGINSIGLHGTPSEYSIGQAASHGCVRMFNQDVIALYERVTIGTPVVVVP
jgi:lipoprotein-anchoring transpeptidase ErfK/SrfK